ncbi:MAG: hypothetical protein OEQ39_09685 [Gammaproteobacteria bacterium]|nr:hypothetical protein [Gammaproteobacteria bacterium]MDH3466024.1 hypothetical protein [Gammaproteobacteria bacterium]
MVGAGSAGCVLAYRLTENPDVVADASIMIGEKASDLFADRTPEARQFVPVNRPN